MQKSLLACIILFFFGGIAHAQNPLLTLAECIEIALANNSEVKREAISVKRSENESKQAKFNLLPGINAQVSHGINQGRSVDPTTNQFIESTFNSGNQGIGADLSVFDGMYRFYDIRMKAQAFEASKWQFSSKLNAFKLEIIEAYINVLIQQDLLEQAENRLSVINEHFRIAHSSFEEGAFPPGDYFDLKGQLKQDEIFLDSQGYLLEKAKNKLARLMQIDKEELGELASLELQANVALNDEKELFLQAQNLFPSFQVWDFKIAEAKNQVGMARSSLFPSLSLSAGLNSRYSSYSNSLYWDQFNQNLGKYVSLNLRIPLFNRMQTLHQVKLAKLNLQDLQLQKLTQIALLKEETANAIFDLKLASSSLVKLKEQFIYLEESFRIASAQFEAGLNNSYLFLLAKNKLDEAGQQLVIKEYEYIFQTYINDYYQGKITY